MKSSILIIVSKFFMGGFSKSLLNFLLCCEKYPEIDIAVLSLLKNENDMYKEIPSKYKYIALDGLEYAKSGRIVYRIKLLQKIRNIEYVLKEAICKAQKKELPPDMVMKFTQYQYENRAKTVITDFSFASKYDYVISWEEGFCNYLLAEKIPGKKKIGYIHPNYVETQFCKKIDRRNLKKLDRIVAISQSCYQTLIDVFPEFKKKIVYIPNRLNADYYKALSNQYNVQLCSDNNLILLTVARIHDKHKGVFRIVRIVKRLINEGFSFRWYIVGDGVDLPELKRRIHENGVDDIVICVGELDNPCPYMVQADLYVQQSHYEGRPVAVDEAMLLGTPALLTNYSSAHEQVKEGVNGWIVEDNEDAIYNQLKVLLSNPDYIKTAATNLKSNSFIEYEDCTPMTDMLNSIE